MGIAYDDWSALFMVYALVASGFRYRRGVVRRFFLGCKWHTEEECRPDIYLALQPHISAVLMMTGVPCLWCML